ncbi:MAG TPA: hypothetical protein VG204_01545 [Terriglobia bacterium]|nr:hypothetical protein [Terriglobia bacterium]
MASQAKAPQDSLEPGAPLFIFPEPPSPGLCEWPGTPIGLSNTITRTKGRTAVHNKTIDSTPGLLEKLLQSAEEHIKRIEGKQPVFEHDVIIHGVRVRATTNSLHLHDFWVDNWYGVNEWQRLTGQTPSSQPRVKVYAFYGVENEPEAAYYSYRASTIIFFNTSYYGQLKSWVLGAVGRILAGEYGIHSIHGACVEKAGKGVLYIAPTGTGKSTSSYGLVTWPNTRFHSDDWVYVRYAYATRDAQRVLVLDGEGSDGSMARGYKVYRWIERHADDPAARLSAMTLTNEQLELRLGDLDLTQPPAAYAYTSEKVFYLRTNLVENFPLAALEIMRSKEENVPDVSVAFLERYGATIDSILADLKGAHGNGADRLDGTSDLELRQVAGRLIAFDNARSMLDISKVLPADRVFTNPMQPVRLAAVMLLKRDAGDPTVLNHVLLEPFMERLLVGETPDKKRETAYNAYRSVDDRAERAFIESLEKQTSPSRSLYSLFTEALNVPPSLEEEFELFRVMYNAARTYDLNTILQRDPRIRDKREAVEQTLAIIARTVEREPHPIRLTLDNYRDFLR